jgi:uncharacterized protein (DUF305 family)
MKLSLFGFVGSLLFLVLVLAASGTRTTTGTTNSNHSGSMSGMNMGTPTASSPTSDPMTDSLKTMSGKEFEIKFMQYMIVHHQAAVQMAQLVATHTNRPELKTMANSIIREQSQEITEMTTWLKQWYGAKPLTNPMSVPGMMEMMASMNRLKTAHNATFDKEFLSMMIQHHQEAINMACYQAKHSVHNCSLLGKTSSKRKVQKFNKCGPGKSSGSAPNHGCKKSYATSPLTWGEGTFFEKKTGRCMYPILGTIPFSMAALHTTSQQTI